jgi:hypothetical protein
MYRKRLLLDSRFDQLWRLLLNKQAHHVEKSKDGEGLSELDEGHYVEALDDVGVLLEFV